MHRSAISWTDFSGGYLNFVWRGRDPKDCKVSPACDNCYVDRVYARMGDRWPEQTTVWPEKLERLARVQFREGDTSFRRGPGSRPMAFVCDTGDLFHHRVPDDTIFTALDIFLERDDVVWQILTKRADRMAHLVRQWLAAHWLDEVPDWMWLMVTGENQRFFDYRVAHLLSIPAAVRGVSIEPCLELIEVSDEWLFQLQWIVLGGESGAGTKARPMGETAPRVWRDRCRDHNVAFHFKQWGAHFPPEQWPPSTVEGNPLTYLDGRQHQEFPFEQ